MKGSSRNVGWIDPGRVAEAIGRGRGRGVRIAILDTGIEKSHPGLSGLKVRDDLAIALKGGRLQVEEGRGVDLFGHGSAVAGIIHDVAPEAEVGSMRVIGEGFGGRPAVIKEAARFALDLGYHIINCSFGCVGKHAFLPGFKEWIDDAYLRNCHVVAASNNEDSGTVEWPSHFPSVIGVAHREGAGKEELFYSPGKFVEFSASGEMEAAVWMGGSRKRVLGSSFASPRIAGILARLLSVEPETTVLTAKAALVEYARGGGSKAMP